MERRVLKSNAKNQLKGKWCLTIAALIIAGMIGSVASGIVGLLTPGLGIIVSFCIQGIVAFGIATYALNVTRDNDARFTDIFDGFNSHIILKAIVLGIIITITVSAGLIIFIIPGIIIGLMFSQSFFILFDNPELTPIECIKASAEMMRGHKAECFILYLSFIGWAILIGLISTALIWGSFVVISPTLTIILFVLGIVASTVMGLFLSAYVLITFANYYVELRAINDIM
ncbi:MAG TPA: hypothetical protein DG753_11125 [Clostridium sp.]|nr:hypothetical protein [Clostridium sp.]